MKRAYTMSDKAYLGLYTRFCPKPATAPTPTRQVKPYSSAFGVDYIEEAPLPTRLEGASWVLWVLAARYPHVSDWRDTRPKGIKIQHRLQIEGDPSIDAEPTRTRLARWWLEDQPLAPRTLLLDEPTRKHYSLLAKHYRLDVRGKQRLSGSFVAAALEALGLGWLSPPEGYEALIGIPNHRKYRSEFKYQGKRKKYGNKQGTVFDISKEEMDKLLTPVHTPLSTTFTKDDYDWYTQHGYDELARRAKEYLDNV